MNLFTKSLLKHLWHSCYHFQFEKVLIKLSVIGLLRQTGVYQTLRAINTDNQKMSLSSLICSKQKWTDKIYAQRNSPSSLLRNNIELPITKTNFYFITSSCYIEYVLLNPTRKKLIAPYSLFLWAYSQHTRILFYH